MDLLDEVAPARAPVAPIASSPPVSAPITPLAPPTPALAIPKTASTNAPTPPKPDLLSPAPSSSHTLADIRANRLAEAATIPATPLAEQQRQWDAKYEDWRKANKPDLLYPAPPEDMPPRPAEHQAPGYAKVSGKDFESIIGTERSARGTPVGEAYQSGHVQKDQDGNYIVTKGLADAIAAEKAGTPQPQQSLGQDLKNVPGNIGGQVSSSIAGLVNLAGQAVQYPAHVVKTVTGAIAPSFHAAETATQPLATAGAAIERQGDYLAAGAEQTQKDYPVEGVVGKQLVGLGSLGFDAAMGTLTGGQGFVASFAGRSMGNMYRQSLAQDGDKGVAFQKALTAGFTAAIAPQIAHILPPQVGEEISAQVAKAYMGTGGMVAAQATADELLLKAGTPLKVDLSHVFPEAAVQGLIGVAMHGAGNARIPERKAADSGTFDLAGQQRVPSRPEEVPAPLPPHPSAQIDPEIQRQVRKDLLSPIEGDEIQPPTPPKEAANVPPQPPVDVVAPPPASDAVAPPGADAAPVAGDEAGGETNKLDAVTPEAKVSPEPKDLLSEVTPETNAGAANPEPTIDTSATPIVQETNTGEPEKAPETPTPPEQLSEKPANELPSPADKQDEGKPAQRGDGADVVPSLEHAPTVAEEKAATPQLKPEPPRTGKLDALESWARGHLEKMGPTGLRGGIPVDPIGDTKRLALHSIILASKAAKAGVKFVEWAADAVKEVPELAKVSKARLMQVFAQARKIGKMDEESRAEYVQSAFTVGGEERTKTTVRRAVGMVRDPAKIATELGALGVKLRAEAKGGAEGFRAAQQQGTGVRKELVRIIKENLPPDQAARLMGDVAKADTVGKMALGIRNAQKLLADHQVKEALSGLEDLTGNMEVHVIRPPKPQKATAEKTPRVMGDVQPDELKTVNLKTLPKDVRDEVAALIEKGRYLKDRLRNAAAGASIPQKQAAVEAFTAIDREIRQTVANHMATQELRVGDRLVTRDKIASDIVTKLGTDAMEAPRTSEATGVKNESLKRLWGRQALSMDAIASNMVGEGSDAYKLTIDQVRQGQSAYHGEQRKTHEAFSPALEKAGIPAGSKKLDDWLTKRETVKLPDLGDFALTRNEMLDIVATAGDPETKQIIDNGVRWSFENHLRETPTKLTPKDIEALRAKLKPEELALIDVFTKLNKDMTPAAMRAKIDLSGWAPEPHEGYYPRSRNRMQGQEAGLPEGWRGYLDRALENISSMKERAADLQQPLRVKGFIGRVFDHFDDNAKLIHLAEPVRSAAAVWQHPEVAKAVTRRYGESMNTRVDQFLKDTMMVRSNPPPGAVGRAWQAVARNVSRAWLQLNPSPMAKNMVGGTLSLLPEFEVKDWAHGVSKMLSPAVYKRMIEGSGVAWSRYHGGLYGAYSPLSGGRPETVAELSFGEAVKAMKPGQAIDAIPLMEYADGIPLRAAWAASENYIERTQPELKGEEKTRAVADKFERALYRTQNGGSSTEISGFASSAKGNPMLSAFLMFKSDSAKKYSLLAMMKEADAATRAKTMASIALNAVASATVLYGLKQGASAVGRAIGGADEDPKEKQKMRENAVWSSIKDIAGIVPMGGAAVEAMRMATTKGHADIASNPVESTIEGTIDTTMNLGRAAIKWSESAKDTDANQKAYDAMLSALWKASKGVSVAGGVPLIPLINLGERAAKAGKYKAPDPRDVKRQDESKAEKAFRSSLPASVTKLLDEKNKLDTKGKAATDAEKQRRATLTSLETQYKNLQHHVKQGNKAEVERRRKELIDAAGKL